MEPSDYHQNEDERKEAGAPEQDKRKNTETHHWVRVYSHLSCTFGVTYIKRRPCCKCNRREAGTVHDGGRAKGLLHLCYECSEDAINARWPHVGLTPTGGAILSCRALNKEKQQEWRTAPLREAASHV